MSILRRDDYEDAWSILRRDDFEDAWERALDDKGPEDSTIFLHRSQYAKHRCLSVMNDEEMEDQAKRWKKQIEDGKISKPLDGNCKTTTVDGKKYHFLTIQPTDLEHCDFDALGMFVLGFVVSGYIYVFENENKRDRIKEYLCK